MKPPRFPIEFKAPDHRPPEDRLWFEANPDRQYRVRQLREGDNVVALLGDPPHIVVLERSGRSLPRAYSVTDPVMARWQDGEWTDSDAFAQWRILAHERIMSRPLAAPAKDEDGTKPSNLIKFYGRHTRS
jgi:hypothetical protein